MGQGGLSKALIIISKAKGWDPTRIFDPRTGYGESIENFNKPPELFTNQAGTGKLPQGTPDSFPDAKAPEVSGGIESSPPFESPELRENQNHRTRGSDPFSGMGWKP